MIRSVAREVRAVVERERDLVACGRTVRDPAAEPVRGRRLRADVRTEAEHGDNEHGRGGAPQRPVGGTVRGTSSSPIPPAKSNAGDEPGSGIAALREEPRARPSAMSRACDRAVGRDRPLHAARLRSGPAIE